MKKKTYGFGIIGAGMISGVHAMAIAHIDNAKLIGVYNINKKKADDFADKNNCIAFNTLDELASHPEIDIVCICTPSGLHHDPAITCIAAGKHCVIEKPLEVTLEKCDKIINAADKAGIKIAVIFPTRFYEASKQLKKSIEEKRFGNFTLGDAYVKWYRTPEYYKSAAWRGTRELDGGGALMNQGIHSIDLLQWYMGTVESVQAVSANVLHKEIEVEDTIVSTVKFANGALGTVECSTAAFPGTLKRIELMGTKGCAILEESKLIKWEFQEARPGDDEIIKSISAGGVLKGGASNPADINFVGHQWQIEDMIQSIETGKNPVIDGPEGRKSVEIVLAIYESARQGKAVKLPLS